MVFLGHALHTAYNAPTVLFTAASVHYATFSVLSVAMITVKMLYLVGWLVLAIISKLCYWVTCRRFQILNELSQTDLNARLSADKLKAERKQLYSSTKAQLSTKARKLEGKTLNLGPDRERRRRPRVPLDLSSQRRFEGDEPSAIVRDRSQDKPQKRTLSISPHPYLRAVAGNTPAYPKAVKSLRDLKAVANEFEPAIRRFVTFKR